MFIYTIPSNTFTDSGDTLTYSLVTSPNWMIISGMTLSGTPLNAGSTSVTIKATDSRDLFNTTTFGLAIGTGEPPVVVKQPVNKGIPVGYQFQYKILPSIFYSPAPFNISIIQKPTWLDYISEDMTLIGEPSVSDVGINYVTIRADDGFTQADCTFTIEVFNIEQMVNINNGDQNSNIRSKLNNLINFVNKFK